MTWRWSTVYPEDLKYTADHEWVRGGGETVRVGITAYAQEALGDIVFVSLPEVGAHLGAGDAFGEVESTKSVSDVYAPVAGEVVTRNDALSVTPELLNSDPYGDGWLVELKPDEGGSYETLLDAAAYAKHVEES
jgi:glycine cleavage system H protein